jgi:signal transduction histidine kinase
MLWFAQPDSEPGGRTVRAVRPPPDRPDALPQLTLQELFQRLGWFVSIRWFAGLAALLLVTIGWYGFDVRVPPRPVVLTIAAVFSYNALFLLLVTDAYRRHQVSARFISGCANAQIICDMVALAFLMHFTGGVENAFIVFFVCPLVIASELLPNRIAYLHALLGAVLIHLVAWLECAGVLPHVAVGHALGAETYKNPVVVAKFTVALSLLGFATVFLAGSIARLLRRRQAELEAAHARLRDLEESKSFLMRRTSHDLRAPLDALVSMLRAVSLHAGATCDPTLADMLGRAEARAVGLTHLIDELHRYAVLRDATVELRRERVDLADLVQQSVGLYEALAVDRGLQLHADLDRPAFVSGDPSALGELIGNLLSNAIQYTPAGGSVRVRMTLAGDHVSLAVSDTGIGIPPTALPRIFEEFYRAENAKQVFRSGTGMGLPIVKRLVETHGGALAVSSTPGQGTTFTVTLPAVD